MGQRRRLAAVVAMGIVAQLGLGGTPAQAATTAAPYDFDGDGQADLVVGAPLLDVGKRADAGGVAVLAPTTRAVPRRAKVITQSTSRVVGSSRSGDGFGSAVVSADFDDDGYADLAVGHPGEDVGGTAQAGAVTVLYGTAKGLTGARSVEVTQPGGAHPQARFGAALAAVDLDRDGYLDLAVGAAGSGGVTVLRGSTSGLRTDGSTLLGGAGGPSGDPEVGSATAFAVGNVDDQAGADLVVLSSATGAVSYCAARASTPILCTRLAQVGAGATQVVVGRFFDFNDTPLSLGPQVMVGGRSGDGSVTQLQLVRARRGGGPAYVLGGRILDRQLLGLPVEPGTSAGFGASLAAGDVTGDTYDDLVVGAPGEGVGGRSAGRVYVIPGSSRSLEPQYTVAFDESTPGVPGRAQSGDRFGGSVALTDRDGDGTADLVVGSPGEDHGRGRVTVLLGTGSGFTTTGAGSFDLSTYGDDQRSTGFGTVLGG